MGNSLSAADPLRLLKQPTPFLRQYGVGGMYAGADGAGPSGGRQIGEASSTFDFRQRQVSMATVGSVPSNYGADSHITPERPQG